MNSILLVLLVAFVAYLVYQFLVLRTLVVILKFLLSKEVVLLVLIAVAVLLGPPSGGISYAAGIVAVGWYCFGKPPPKGQSPNGE